MEVIKFNRVYKKNNRSLFNYNISVDAVKNNLFEYDVYYNEDNEFEDKVRVKIARLSIIDNNLYLDFEWFIKDYLRKEVKEVIENEVL